MPPDYFQKQLNEARELLQSGEFSPSLAIYEKLTRQQPGIASIWYEYGSAAAKLRQLDVTTVAWDKALDLDPRNTELAGIIGHQYQSLRLSAKAREAFIRAAAADPRGINPRISLAVLLEKMNLLAEARAAVEECLAIASNDDQGR
jgi:tetratricopeptide (TPR) repeat protein